jgi:hypothetical protein
MAAFGCGHSPLSPAWGTPELIEIVDQPRCVTFFLVQLDYEICNFISCGLLGIGSPRQVDESIANKKARSYLVDPGQSK